MGPGLKQDIMFGERCVCVCGFFFCGVVYENEDVSIATTPPL